MASIYKRGHTWWIHYLIGGKSVSRSLKTTSERVALEKKKRIQALEITEQLAQPSNTPIKALLQDFGEFLLKTRTFKSAKNDISYLRQFFGPCCPVLEMGSKTPRKYRQNLRRLPTVPDTKKHIHVPVSRLEQISAEMVSGFIRGRIVDDGVAPKTANRFREVLHRMFTYAIEHHRYVCPDIRYRNPVQGVRRQAEPAPVIVWLSQEQIQEQLAALEDFPMLRAMVATYIYTGLRREEALWLTKTDIDLVAKIIHLRAKEVDGEFWQPKTKRNRSVPISQDLYHILAEYTPPVESRWFFPGPTGGRWNPDNFSEKLREINKGAGLDWSCLIFRHTFGSQLAQKGESIFKISELMGNSPQICRRHYAALVPEAMRDTVEFAKPSALAESGDESTEALLKKLLASYGKSIADPAGAKLQPKLRLVR